MPLDPNILLAGKGIETPSPFAMAQQGLTISDLATGNAMKQYALRTVQRNDAAQQALGQVLPALQAGGFSDQAVQTALTHPLVQQNPEVAAKILETVDTVRKNQAAAAKDKAVATKDIASSQTDLLRPLTNQAFSLANDPDLTPDKTANFFKSIAANGLQNLVPNLPFQDWNDPVKARQALKTIGASFFEAEKQVSTAETGRHNLADEAGAAATRAETAGYHQGELGVQRGNLGVNQARLALERDNAGKPTIQTDAEGNIFSVNPRTATGQQIMGPDGLPLNKGQKPLTETQGNATAYGMRMKSANDAIAALADKGVDLSDPRMMLATSSITNPIASADAQLAMQAKRNFMTASLRKESGAAISQSEFDTENKKYFPQWGDSPDVIAQKTAARDLAIRAMTIQAGPGGKNIAAETGGLPGSSTKAAAPDVSGWQLQRIK